MARPLHTTVSFFRSSSVPIALVMFFSIPWFIELFTLKSDIEVLRSLKQAIDPNSIPNFSFLSTWNFQADPCESSGGQFLGILCTLINDSINRISVLDLDEGGYDGFLETTIGNLTELTTLNLRRNRFRGPLPTTIFNLRKLTRLTLPEKCFHRDSPPEN
ncbi:Leucine-rich repeat receptor-like protein kinase precursor [Actinidia chinensis var. chinensis]|uniref:Leucine-rich repeat receptor-like protein kinase n=1 Tax=Actinidia chinensis var. chinensis TaxID=1590841 RepID=A0A2R6RY33_ACTCC|nr:Leucine-rich repeat receptor-like protein kinase precursor [Actinidia chinensis var. chinensis]